jgi:hypothetical protein
MGRAALAPEARLLFLAGSVSPSDSALRRFVTAGLDWEELAALAQRENAAAVLARQLSFFAADPHNPGYQNLRQLARMSAMQMLQLESSLRRTIELLRRHEIEPILLKGAGLVYSAYSSFADRPMADVDLLVGREEAKSAWAVLQTQGWSPWQTTSDSRRFSGHHHLPRLVHESGTLPLEIHDALLSQESPFRFSIDEIWARAEKLTARDQLVTVPHAMHQLWHACVHFAWSHEMQWGSWRTFRDVSAIISRGGVDWIEFQNLARSSRATTCCFWTLRLARRLTGAAVPDATLESLRPPYPTFIVNRLERHLLANLVPSANSCPSVRLRRRLWEMAIAPRWSGHGASRPWKMSERWMQAPETHRAQHVRGASIMERLRQVTAGGGYIMRVSRLSLPVDSS